MSPYKRWAALFALALALVMVLTSCAPATPEVVKETVVVEKPVKETVVVEKEVKETVIVKETPETPVEKVLRINIATYPDIIDPQKSSFVNEIAHLILIYEGLTKFDATLQTVPGAAESWEYNDDATELTFTLREGLTYSDGSVLNALRFKYALMRNINPETAGEYAYITDEIKGAADWRGAEDDEAKAAGQAVVDESIQAMTLDGQACADYDDANCRLLKITLAQPAPYFHTVMGIWVAFPAKEENITEGGPNWWNSSKYQIGNGPFILQSLEPFVRARFTPNPNYWAGVAKTDIEYAYITDSAVAFQAYKNDEFDIITMAAEDYATVMNDPELTPQANVYAGSCTFGWIFHIQKEPFSDPLVRKAFAMALDRDAYVADVLQGLGTSTLTWIPPGFPGYDDSETRWGFDPEAAKQALADSSYGGAENLPEIVDTYADTPRNRVRHEWLAAQWKEVLGVEITLNPVEPTTYTALTKDIATAPQFFLLGWCSDYPDPQNWLSVYWKTGAQATNMVGYSNPELDAILAEADTTLDEAKRMELYAQAQDMLIEEMPAAFFYNSANSYLIKPWVKGVTTTPQDLWPGSYSLLDLDIDTSLLP